MDRSEPARESLPAIHINSRSSDRLEAEKKSAHARPTHLT